MSVDTYVLRSSAIASRVLGDEAIVMSPADSTLFSINVAGTAIWEAMDGKTPLAQIVKEKICTIFDVDLEPALKDAERFVERLSQHGIVRIADHPITDTESR
jgi:predicted Rdx family selenoprotein